MTPPVPVRAPVKVNSALAPVAVRATVLVPAVTSWAAAVFETVKFPLEVVTETAPLLVEIPLMESTAPIVRAILLAKVRALVEPVMLAARFEVLLAWLSVTEPALVKVRLVSVMVAEALCVMVLPERNESTVVPPGAIAAVTVTAPLVVRPRRMIPAVTVSTSAVVSPKVPKESAPPISTS